MDKKSRRRTSHKSNSNRQSKRAGRAAPHRSLRVETLEERLLLAADLVTENQSQALRDGLGSLSEFFDRVDNTDALSAPLPLLTQVAGVDPIDVNIGEQLDIGGIVFATLTAPVTTYLESSFDPTSTGISDAINVALSAINADTGDGLTITGSVIDDLSTADELVFEIQFTAMRTVDVQINFDSALVGSPVDVDEVYQTTMDLSYTFDADLIVKPDDASGNDTFFVAFDVAANSISANVGDESDAIANPDGVQLLPALSGSVGFLGVETLAGSTESGSVEGSTLDIDANVPLSFAGQPVEGYDAAALLATPIRDLVSLDTSDGANQFSMTLPMVVTFDGLDLGANPADADKPRVVVSDPNLFDGEFDLDDPFFVLENGDQLTDFRTVTAVGMFSAMQSLQGIFSQMQSSDVFQKEIPFTDGKTLTDVLDLNSAFGLQVTDKLDGEDSQNPGAAFNNVQQFVNLLASRINYVADDDGDPTTHDPAITFDLDFQHQFDVAQFDLDFGFDLGELANFTTDSQVSLEADLDAKLQLGVLLRRAEGGLPLTRDTELGLLNGGDGIDLSSMLSFTLRNGREFDVDVSGLGAMPTLRDLIDRIEQTAAPLVDNFDYASLTQAAKDAIAADPIFGPIPESLREQTLNQFGSPAGMFRVLIGDDQDALEIVDSTHINIFGGELTPGVFSLKDSITATNLGLAEGRSDDTHLMGRPINGRFELDNDTELASLNRGMGVDTVSPALSSGDPLDDVKVTLQDGSTFMVDLSAAVTIIDVITAFGDAAAGADFEVTFNEDYTGLALVDRTMGTSELSVEGLNGSLAAVSLGIAGTGDIDEENGSSRIEGAPLHGRTLFDSLFIRQAPASFGSSATLTTASTTIELGTGVASSGADAVATANDLSIQLPTGSNLSGVLAGDRLKLEGVAGDLEIIGVNDRDDTLDVAVAPAPGTYNWSVESNVNLSRVMVGDLINLEGRTDGIDGTDQFAIVGVNDTNDTIEVEIAPTSDGESIAWSIERLAPMVSGTVRVIGEDVDVAATLGFVEVTVENGTAVGQITADLSLGDTGTDEFDDRVTFNEAYDGLRDVALKVTGHNDVTFPDDPANSYGGVLKFTIEEPTEDGSNETVFAIPFFVPGIPPRNTDSRTAGASDDDPAATAANQMAATEAGEDANAADKTNPLTRLLTKELDLSFQAVAAAAALRSEAGNGTLDLNQLVAAVQNVDAPRIRVGNSGNKLTFSLADGVARRLTVSAGQPTDLTDEIGLTEDDVRLILNLLSNVPGLGVDRNLIIDDLVDSEAAVFNLGVTNDPAKVTLAGEPILNEDYSGNLSLVIDDDDMTPSAFTVPFSVAGATTALPLSELVETLNTAIDTQTDRIEVGQSGGHLVFRLADSEMRHPLIVSVVVGSEEAVAKLGLTGDESTADPSAYVARPKITGAGQSDLPINVSLDVGGFTPPSLVGGLLPEISISIPDLSLDDFSLPGALNIDFGDLGDLFAMRDLSLTSVIVAMQTGLAYLEGLEFFDDLEMLNVDLPMVDLNLRDMLNIADAFGDIVILLEANPVAGLGQVEEFLEDAAGIPEDDDGSSGKPSFAVFTIPSLNQGLPEFGGINLADPVAYLTDPQADLQTFPDLESYLQSLQGKDGGSVDVSLDRDGAELAVRIDLAMDILNVNRAAPLQLDLSSLNLPGLSNLLDVSGSSLVSVDAGATIGLSLGIDLTNEAGVKPFLYDVEDVTGEDNTFTGTRVELLVNAAATDIQFSTTVGPLGVEIGPGSLDLSGPVDGKAKLTVGLGNLLDLDPNDDGRHYFEEIVARGDTITLASGRRADVMQGDTTITLPSGSQLAGVRQGDVISVGGELLTIDSVDDVADTVVVFVAPAQSIASAEWKITRGIDVVSGVGAMVTENLLTVQLPQSPSTDLSQVEIGNTITLSGQTGGIDNSDTFEIVAVDDTADTVTIATQPSATDGAVAWSIQRNGDFEFLLGITDLEIDAVGSATANLPVSFPGFPAQLGLDGTLIATIGDLTDFTSIQVTSGGSLFDVAKGALTGDFDLLGMVGGWDGVFNRLTDAMRGQVFGINIPLIGDALKDEADFLDQIRDSVSGNLQDNASQDQNDATSVQSALYDALGPGGLGWLQDIDTVGNTGAPTPDGSVTIDDVVVRPDDSQGLGTGFVFEVHLAQSLQALNLPVDFDLGVPGFELDLNAPVIAKMGFDFQLSMGLNIEDGFYIVTGDNTDIPELQVFVEASIPGLAASGGLAFLRVAAEDIPSAIVKPGGIGLVNSQFRVVSKHAGAALSGVAISFVDDATAGNETVVYDAGLKTLVFHIAAGVTTAADLRDLVNSDPASSNNTAAVFANFQANLPSGSDGSGAVDVNSTAVTGASNFRGEFNVDLVDPDNDDGLLTMGEMLRSSVEDVIAVDLSGVANVNLALMAEMGGTTLFPSIRTDFGLDWNIGLSQGLVLPTIQFTDVEMNLGEFFGDFAAPILGQIQDVLGPVQPVIDALTGRLPVMSDLLGQKVSFLDLAKLYGGTAEVAGFLEGVAQVVTVINALPDIDAGEWLNLGGFRFNVQTDTIEEVFGAAADIFQKLQEIGSNFDPNALLPNELQEEDDNSAKLSFPILSDPSLLFGVLTGKQADLFTFELPTFTFETTFSRFFPIPAFPIVGAEIAGTIGADIDLAFGYDTSGLQRFLNSGNRKDVFDGFFLFDHENADGTGADIPELTLRGALTVAGKATVAVGSASVGGGIFAGIDFNLNDPNDDGKIRGIELLDNALLGNAGLFVFDVSGHVDAGLFARVEIGTGIFSVTKTHDIATVRLLDYDFPRPDGNAVPLAQFNGSTLELNIGANAVRRKNDVIAVFDKSHFADNSETYNILPGTTPDSVIVMALGREQQYDGVTRITGNAGMGDDTIIVHKDISIPVEIYGGDGNDTLIGGAGNDVLRGNAGNDDLRGGDGNDQLRGNDGNDVLLGEDGRDLMFGAAGNDRLDGGDDDDTLEGGDGADILLGRSGNDIIRGNAGNDVLEGATGSDQLFGGADNDSLLGGRDGDMLFGDSGDDELFGNEGSDEIHGGTGSDLVFAGIGNDLVFGGQGDDQLFGENSRDTIYGDGGNDLIVGGLASDDLFGGLGNDVIYSTDQFGTQELARHTIAGGGGDDLIYGEIDNDTIDGDGINDVGGSIDPATDGADTIYALGGDDLVQAGGGDDLVLGGLGRDDIFGGLGDDQLYATDDVETPDAATTAGHILFGGGGNDVIVAHLGNDMIHGDGANQQGRLPLPLLDGDDVIHAMAGNDDIQGGDGNNTIFAGEGNDSVITGSGNDVIFGEDGNDFVDAGAGIDLVDLGAGDDFAAGGLGDDRLLGGLGNDVLFGGLMFGAPVNFDRNIAANYELPSGYAEAEADPLTATGYVPAVLVTPAIVGGVSIVGDLNDGMDNLDGGAGIDALFGGFEADVLAGGSGADYLDAGAGDDQDVQGGDGDDVIRGGAGNDTLDGGADIDHLLGDDGDDVIRGSAGTAAGSQLGQRLFGGAGRDNLFAFAPTTDSVSEAALVGDQLFGDGDGDFLRGNLRQDILIGDRGNDFLHGDLLAGPAGDINNSADTLGANDLLMGGSGEDQLFGGGGNDTIWGGADSDTFEGQAGSDTQYGGSGIDLFYLYTGIGAASDMDQIGGHFGNAIQGDTPDDNATDILVLAGTSADERILFSQNAIGQARIDYTIDYTGSPELRVLTVDVLDGDGIPLIEQFQAAGLGGDDQIGFAMEAPPVGLEDFVVPAGASPLNIAPLAARSNDFVGVFDGNSGNDLLVGSGARDRLDGGSDSDVVYGFAGDDRLWGDSGEGAVNDHDVLFAGGGNDDVIGGQGKNNLYAWSFAPQASLRPTTGASFDPGDVAGLIADGPDANFGVFVDPDSGQLVDTDGDLDDNGVLDTDELLPLDQQRAPFAIEVTGLNRIVGSARNDNLLGGTTLDFLFGNGGTDTLFRADGSTFTSLDGNLAGDAWKDYARESDQVWYVGGTNAADEIRVDFVTEPGLLADHHLITRLTENNGNFSFAAQVRLDFNAADDEGNPIWDAEEILIDANARSATLAELEQLDPMADDERRAELLGLAEISQTDLVNDLLPPEGDFLAIIIDALDGNDLVTVGPTVQKTVWVDAGAGDDRVEIRGGNAILVDKAESAAPDGGLAGRNDLASQAYAVPLTSSGIQLDNLTIDNPNDADWFAFTLAANGTLNVVSESPIDKFTVNVYPASRATDDLVPAILTTTATAGQSIALDLSMLAIGADYLLEVTNNQTPTIYGIEFDFGGTPERIDLGLRSDSVRRDVILGGTGNDILQGGAGEDFIFGGAGNDVITGGLDRNASDVIFGGDGDDTFQIVPDLLPLLGNQFDTLFDPSNQTFIPTFNEQLIGGDGNDRVLFLGGDVDRNGVPVPDFVAFGYNTALHRYEFSSLVWDIENQRFAPDPEDSTRYQQEFMFFQARDVELTQIDTRAGDDVVHAGAGFRFLPVLDAEVTEPTLDSSADPSLFSTWGIDLGDFEQGATLAQLEIFGGAGDDNLYGGVLDDRIDGGAGNDLLVGNLGNDLLLGGLGEDTLFGNTAVSVGDAYPPISGPAAAIPELFEYDLATPLLPAAPERPGVTVIDPGTSSLDDAFGFEGDGEGEQLSQFESIGDFSGDMIDDYLVRGADRSYLLFGPVVIDDLQNIEDAAAIVVDHAVMGELGQRVGDIDNDGLADLAFTLTSASQTDFRIVFGEKTNWPREWNQAFVDTFLDASNSRQFSFTAPELSPTDVTTQWFNYDADGFDDLLITSSTTADTARAVDINGTFTLDRSLTDAHLVIDDPQDGPQLYFLAQNILYRQNSLGGVVELANFNASLGNRMVYFNGKLYIEPPVGSTVLFVYDLSNGSSSTLETNLSANIVQITPGTLFVDESTSQLRFGGLAPNGRYQPYRLEDPGTATQNLSIDTITNNTLGSTIPVSRSVSLSGTSSRLFVANHNGAGIDIIDGNQPQDFGNQGTVNSIGEMVDFNGVLYFVANVNSDGNELWRRNGDNDFTKVAEFPGTFGLNPQSLFVYDSALYFSALGSIEGRELWRYTPSSGPELAVDLNPVGDSNPQNFSISEDGNLYFTANVNATDRRIIQFDGNRFATVDARTPVDSRGALSFAGGVYYATEANVLTRYGRGNVGYVVDGQALATTGSLTRVEIDDTRAFFAETGGFSATVVGDIDVDGRDDVVFQDPDLAGILQEPAVSVADDTVDLAILASGSYSVQLQFEVNGNPATTINLVNEPLDMTGLVNRLNQLIAGNGALNGLVTAVADGTTLKFQTFNMGPTASLHVVDIGADSRDILGFRDTLPATITGSNDFTSFPIFVGENGANLQIQIFDNLSNNQLQSTSVNFSDADFNSVLSIADLVNLLNNNLDLNVATIGNVGNRLTITSKQVGVNIRMEVTEQLTEVFGFQLKDNDSNVIPIEQLGGTRGRTATQGRNNIDPTQLGYRGLLTTSRPTDRIELGQHTAAEYGVGQPDPVFELGDLDNDGFADFGVNEASTLRLFLGNVGFNRIGDETPIARLFEGAAETIVAADATAGDYNHDGLADLAVVQIDGNGASLVIYSFIMLRGQVPTFVSLVDQQIAVDLGDVGTRADTLAQSLPLPGTDLNDDGIDDLTFTDPLVAGTTGTTVDPAGQASVFYGDRLPDFLPSANASPIELANISIPGSGAFLVNRGTGRAEVFDDGGTPFELLAGGEVWFQFSFLGDGKAGDAIRLPAASGLVMDLVDSTGRRLLQARAAIDLRVVEAGSYFLRVYEAVVGVGTTPFSVHIDAPIRGQTHETTQLPDRDVLRGGPGRDILVGNFDHDALIGEGGPDELFGELVEFRGLTAEDRWQTSLTTSTIAPSLPTPIDVPTLLLQDTTTVMPVPIDPVVEIADPALLAAIVTALPGQNTVSGLALRASDLASLTTLDASGLAISDLTGIEALVNLTSLNLNNNTLSNSSLAALMPRRLTSGPQSGELVGLARLRELDLSNNAGITDISNVATLTGLESLNLVGTGVDLTSQATLDALSSLDRIQLLTLPVTGFVPGTNFAASEGQGVTLETLLPGFWTVTNDNGEVVADGDFPTATGDVGLPATVVAGADAPVNGQVQDFGADATLELTVNGVSGMVTLATTSGPAQWHAVNLPDATINSMFQLAVSQVGSELTVEDVLSLNLSGATTDLLVAEFNSQIQQSSSLNGQVIASNLDGRLLLSSVKTGSSATMFLESFTNGALTSLGFDSDFGNLNGSTSHVTSDNLGLADLIADLSDAIGASVHAGEVIAVASGNRISFQTTAVGTDTTLRVADLGQGQNLGFVPQTSGTIEFTPADNGIYTVNHSATVPVTFPILVANVAPSISGLSPILGLVEGDSRTAAELLDDIVANGDPFDTVIDDVEADVISKRVTVTDPAGTVTDLTDAALVFDDSLLQLPNTVLDGANNVTTTFWLKTTHAGGQTVIDAKGGGSDQNELLLYFNSSTELAFGSGATTWTIADIADGAYHHFALVRDAGADQMELFVDGVSAGTRSVVLDTLDINLEKLAIGRDLDSVQPALNGTLDDLSIWHRALTGEQIATVMNGSLSGDEIALAGYWKFNEGAGGVAQDATANAHDGVLGLDSLQPVWTSEVPIATASAGYTFADQGIYTLTATISDDDGGVAVVEATIDVVNARPTVSLGSNQSGQAGQVISIVPMVSDPGSSDTLSYDWEVTANNGLFVLPSTAEEFNFTPEFSGRYIVTLTVTDSDGAGQAAMVVIDVSPAAVINVPAGSSSADSDLVAAAMHDAPSKGALLSFDATDLSLPLLIALRREFSWTATSPSGGQVVTGDQAVFQFIPVESGQYAIDLTITDVFNDVQLSGDAPTAMVDVADSVPLIVGPAEPLYETDTLEFTAADLNVLPPTGATGSLLTTTRTYAWEAKLGGVVVASSASEVFRFIPRDDGLHTINLTVTDTIGDSDPVFVVTASAAELMVNVGNAVPLFDLGADFSAVEGETINLAPTVTDAIDDALTYAWAISGPGVSQGSTDPVLTFTPTDNGLYTITLTVTDDDGAASLLDSVAINVVNAAPQVDVGSDQTVNEGQAVSFDATYADAGIDDGPFTLAWDFGDGNTAVDTLTPTHTYADSGVYQVTLTVTDKDGGVGIGAANVTVNNLAPANLQLVSNLGVFAGQAWELTGSLSDLNGLVVNGENSTDFERLRGTADFGDGSQVPLILRRTIVGLTAEYSFTTTHVFVQPGDYTVQITVRDDDGGVASKTLSITAQMAPSPSASDFDADGDIDGADFLAWQRGFGSTSATKNDGDADNDSDVDGSDLAVWVSQYGQTAPIVAAASVATLETLTEPVTWREEVAADSSGPDQLVKSVQSEILVVSVPSVTQATTSAVESRATGRMQSEENLAALWLALYGEETAFGNNVTRNAKYSDSTISVDSTHQQRNELLFAAVAPEWRGGTKEDELWSYLPSSEDRSAADTVYELFDEEAETPWSWLWFRRQ